MPGEREEDVGRETRPILRPAALPHSPQPAQARPAAEPPLGAGRATLSQQALGTAAGGRRMWPGQPPLLVPLARPQRGQKGGAGRWHPPLREGAGQQS